MTSRESAESEGKFNWFETNREAGDLQELQGEMTWWGHQWEQMAQGNIIPDITNRNNSTVPYCYKFSRIHLMTFQQFETNQSISVDNQPRIHEKRHLFLLE
ncbi:unnamed protein product [Owenia fusiformis]|uniref:Uncharacterized protein n=1 Tax=Owenia fusiformis TaxID=6347 RepID=A0A8S4QB87_OWEFU|nr:unnamed protein product [Owenia fusiformis]